MIILSSVVYALNKIFIFQLLEIKVHLFGIFHECMIKVSNYFFLDVFDLLEFICFSSQYWTKVGRYLCC